MSARLVRHLVQDGCDREHQYGVLPRCDPGPAGAGDPESLPGHLGHRGPAVLDGVLVLEDVALDVQVRAVCHLDSAERRLRGLPAAPQMKNDGNGWLARRTPAGRSSRPSRYRRRAGQAPGGW